MESLSCVLPSKPSFAYLNGLIAATREGKGWCSIVRLRNSSSSQAKLLLSSSQKTWTGRTLQDKYSPRAAGASQVDLTKDGEVAPWKTAVPVNDLDDNDRINKLVREIKENLRSMDDGELNPSAYDTAWVARIPSVDNPNKPHFPMTLDWILKNQQEDGSWGEPSFFLLYDRLVCTLACLLALKIWKAGETHVDKGLKFLRSHVEKLGKETDSLRTCGFEITFPSMLNEARSLGLDLPYDLPCLKEIITLREKKIKRIPVEVMHSVHTTLLYTLEALQEVVQWDRILVLQSRHGSFLGSPAATAMAYMKTRDKKCLEFLTHTVYRFGDNAPCTYPIDLSERIWAVDTIQRLGIDHHFRMEISDILDYVHRNTGKLGVSWARDSPVADVDDTCMALRLLRLHGYAVSPDVLEYFKDVDGNIVCFPGETHRGVSDMFNLYRFSQISFPGERILKEAKASVEQYLRTCVENNQVEDKWSLKKALKKEVERALENPWRLSFQRLEARDYINQYGENDVWIGKAIYWMYNVNNPKYLELAKLDFNRLQNIYKGEIHSILQWWNGCAFGDPYFTQVCPKETHFSIAATLYEPEFSASRIAYTKCNCIENVLKDLFESHESIDDLRLLYKATEQWNPSLVHSLPHAVKMAFMGMYDTLNELAIQASNTQGKDMFPYLHDLRLKQLQACMENREIRGAAKIASLEEYIEQGKKDVGAAIRILPAMFLMEERLQDHVLKSLDDSSWILDQLSLFLTILIDVQKHKNSLNKNTSDAIACCMKEENCTADEALSHLQVMMEDAFDELVHEYLKLGRVPRSCRRLIFEHARIIQFFLKDGIDPATQSKRISDGMECLFTPV